MRRKVLKISGDLLIDFLKTPIPPGIRSTGIPADAKVVLAGWDAGSEVILLLLESDEFEPVELLRPYPVLDSVLFHKRG